MVAITEKEQKERDAQRTKALQQLKDVRGFSEEGGEGDAY